MFWNKRKSGHFDYSQLHADMHSHLVPGIDDGAADISTSISLLKGLVDLGYKKIITTPHIMWDMYKNTREDILRGYEELQKAIAEEGIDVEVQVGAEYFLDDHLKLLLEKKEPLLTIGENMVLVEFSLASRPLDFKELLFEMQLQEYQPLIAHPERYIYPEKGKRFFDEMRASGYLFQLNILSLIGGYGKEVQRQAHYLINQGFYDYVGTDLHHQRHLESLYDHDLNSHLKKLVDSGNIRNKEL